MGQKCLRELHNNNTKTLPRNTARNLILTSASPNLFLETSQGWPQIGYDPMTFAFHRKLYVFPVQFPDGIEFYHQVSPGGTRPSQTGTRMRFLSDFQATTVIAESREGSSCQDGTCTCPRSLVRETYSRSDAQEMWRVIISATKASISLSC